MAQRAEAVFIQRLVTSPCTALTSASKAAPGTRWSCGRLSSCHMQRSASSAWQLQVARDTASIPPGLPAAAVSQWSSGTAAQPPAVSSAQHSVLGVQSTAVESSPFSHSTVQNHEPPQGKATAGPAGSEHLGDSLGAPKASGDVWDNNRPLASPFVSMQSGPTFDQSGDGGPGNDALGNKEPHRFSTEDIATLASGTRLQGADLPRGEDSVGKSTRLDGSADDSLHKLGQVSADSLHLQGNASLPPGAAASLI